MIGRTRPSGCPRVHYGRSRGVMVRFLNTACEKHGVAEFIKRVEYIAER